MTPVGVVVTTRGRERVKIYYEPCPSRMPLSVVMRFKIYYEPYRLLFPYL